MPFYIREPIEMFVMDSEHEARLAGTLKSEWKPYEFPTPTQLRSRTSYAMKNLSMLKVMMAQSDLLPGRDYIFMGATDRSQPLKSTTIGFKDEAEGLMSIFRWIGSDWYRTNNQ